MKQLVVGFYAHGLAPEALERVGFYRHDLRILKDLGHRVVVATSVRELPGKCDLYFVWWWNYAVLALLRARLGRRPVIVTGVFDYEHEKGSNDLCYVTRPWWQKQLLRSALRYADANVFISEYERALVSEKLYVRNPTMIPLVVDDPGNYDEGRERERFFLNVAWSGGYNARRKCLPQIIEAFARVSREHSDVRLLMAGKQGEAHPGLLALAKTLRVADRIEFLGVISEEAKIDLMHRCLAYLQPSMFEGFGLATAEAMVCGAPVVSSPVGAAREVVGDAGYMVDGANISELARAMQRIIEQPQEREEMGRRARLHVLRQFPYERRKQRLAAVIDRLCR